MYDFGEYQCEISNLKGITSKTIRLEQHEEMQWDISPFDSNITAYIGDNITLVCNTVGLTECHEMSWIKKNSYGTNETTIARNKQLVSDGSDDDDSQARYHLVPNTIQYTVEIHGVDVRDEGQWECRVGDGYTQQTEIVWISLKYIEGNSITSTVISSTVTMATLFVLSLIILSKFI
uniref:Uncharacterized protein LOC102809953 n=1 Tax=Saccoglossus kowalevskii TaxID=10224 RepID=A0ABM0MP52_SACKO|nr:PREDICTED: uncharacterized protein LOC102809953 [Saccoglossus kowalevskii]